MKPIEVGFDGSFILSNNYQHKIMICRSNKPVKEWEKAPIDNSFIWLYTDKDNPQLLYKNKEGKLYSVNLNFEPFEE